MDAGSRATLTEHLTHLRGRDRDRLDTLSFYPSTAVLILQAMVHQGDLELVYPSNGYLDLHGILRFCLFTRRRRLGWPRFEWWGNLIAVRVTMGRDIDAAVDIIDSCFGAVFGVIGPFQLEFQRMGWLSADDTAPS